MAAACCYEGIPLRFLASLFDMQMRYPVYMRSMTRVLKAADLFLFPSQSRTESNACSRVRLALALGKRNELRMISYALT